MTNKTKELITTNQVSFDKYTYQVYFKEAYYVTSKTNDFLSHVDNKNYKAEQVLAADAVYAVFYEDKPINLRSLHTLIDLGAKYKKVSFSNAGHSHNLAEKLNKLFKTDKFSVYKLTSGEKITENEQDL